MALVPNVLQVLMPPLAPTTNVLLVLLVQLLMLDQSFLPTVLTATRKPMDVSLAHQLAPVNAQSVMPDTTTRVVPVTNVLQELMPPLLTPTNNVLLVLMVQLPLLVQSFLPTVLTATRKPLDVSLALQLRLANAQSVMPDTT